MVKRIAVVSFNDDVSSKSTTREYEYLLPEDAPDNPKWVVVRATAHVSSITTPADMRIVKVKDVRLVEESTYEGLLKPVVHAFSTDWWEKELETSKKRAALLAKIERKLTERSKVAQLEALVGSDEEAKALLEAFKKLG